MHIRREERAVQAPSLLLRSPLKPFLFCARTRSALASLPGCLLALKKSGGVFFPSLIVLPDWGYLCTALAFFGYVVFRWIHPWKFFFYFHEIWSFIRRPLGDRFPGGFLYALACRKAGRGNSEMEQGKKLGSPLPDFTAPQRCESWQMSIWECF